MICSFFFFFALYQQLLFGWIPGTNLESIFRARYGPIKSKNVRKNITAFSLPFSDWDSSFWKWVWKNGSCWANYERYAVCFFQLILNIIIRLLFFVLAMFSFHNRLFTKFTSYSKIVEFYAKSLGIESNLGGLGHQHVLGLYPIPRGLEFRKIKIKKD